MKETFWNCKTVNATVPRTNRIDNDEVDEEEVDKAGFMMIVLLYSLLLDLCMSEEESE
jgi:hypothetical protein